ncbi:MAG TPA: hypothetical protein VF736_07600 [Pyrinomonadaceae bacterium]
MRSLLLALLLPAALAAHAHAQQRTLEGRAGDSFVGPVREARMERALFVRQDGALVEGPRRLAAVCTYTPDGRRMEYKGYAPDGSLQQRFVHVYDDAGNEVEKFWYEADGTLKSRAVYNPAAGERLTFNGDGSLRERSVAVRGPDGRLLEARAYGGDGALKERSVNTSEGKVSTWSTYGPGGVLKKRATHSLDYGGPHRTVEEYFAPDGSVARRRVVDSDAASSNIRAVEEGPGARRPKTRETREYDSRRNLSKVTDYILNDETGEYEPVAVSYSVVTYYR